MTISIVQNTNNSVGGGTSVTTTYGSSVSTSNKLIAIMVGGGTFGASIAVTDSKSNTWSKVAEDLNRGDVGASVWECSPATGGTSFSVTATFTGGSSIFAYLTLLEVSGLGSFDTGTTKNASSTAPNVTGSALAVATELVIAAFSHNGTSGSAEASGTYTSLQSDFSDSVQVTQTSYKITSAATAPTASWGGSPATDWVAVVAAWQATAFISAALASTEAQDTAAAAGMVAASAALASTEARDVAAFSVSAAASGSLASTEAPDTTTIAAAIATTGTLASTEAPDVAAFAGSVPLSGALASTEAKDTTAATGNAQAPGGTGAMASTDTPDSASVTAVLSPRQAVTATSAKTYLGQTTGRDPMSAPRQIVLPQVVVILQ